MNDREEPPHHVDRREGRFRVLDDSDRVLLVCGDETSATKYAVLLNEAFRRGYKAGYRAARPS